MKANVKLFILVIQTQKSNIFNNRPLEISQEEKDLDINVSDNFEFSSHVSKVAARANGILGRIKRTFTHLNVENACMLYTSLVRPHLEYAVQRWYPHLRKDIEILEQVQRWATRLVPELSELPYQERLRAFNLTSREGRCIRGDAIETYKIMRGLDDVDSSQFFNLIREGPLLHTRGHPLKLETRYARTERHRNFFSVRAVGTWNSLPSDVVLSNNLNQFKNKYDNLVIKNRAGTSTSLAP